MNNTKYALWTLLFILLLIPLSIASEEEKISCEDSGGTWSENKCKCPFSSKLVWSKCWTKTPKQACLDLGGTIHSLDYSKGDTRENFKCIVNGEVATWKAINHAKLANLINEKVKITFQPPLYVLDDSSTKITLEVCNQAKERFQGKLLINITNDVTGYEVQGSPLHIAPHSCTSIQRFIEVGCPDFHWVNVKVENSRNVELVKKKFSFDVHSYEETLTIIILTFITFSLLMKFAATGKTY